MKTKIFTLIIFGLLISTQASAKKQYILLGGGGEPSGTTTIFDSDLTQTRGYLDQASEWNKEVSFNGGHSNTESILSTRYTDSQVSNFTEKKYKEIIQKYVDQINAGEFKSGDQILVQIDTHGAAKYGKQETHDIAVAKSAIQNYDSLGSSTVNMDDLKKLTTLAKEKGIKVGIIDQSCHSGNTLALADDNTCVLTVTGPNHYGYAGQGTDSDRLTEKMAPGKNLEDLFLEARKDSNDTGFPMISSPEGKEVQEQLYELITPYLYYFDKRHDKLAPYIMNGEGELACKYDKDFEQLNKIIDQVEDIQVVTRGFWIFKWQTQTKKVDLEPLKTSLKSYYDLQKEIVNETAGIDLSIYNTSEKFTASNGRYQSSIEYTWKELITIDYDNVLKYNEERLAKASNKYERESIELNMELYRKAQARGKELAIKYPQYNQLKAKMETISNKENRSYQLASDVGRSSRKLYDELYKKARDANTSNQPNPCREFVL